MFRKCGAKTLQNERDDYMKSIIKEKINLCKRRAQYYKTVLTAVKRYSFGKKNKNKKFIILKSYSKNWGIYSTVLLLLPFMERARQRNYIPIVDFSKQKLPLLQDEKRSRRENAWEYYYKQPEEETSLIEVYQSKNVRIVERYCLNAPIWAKSMPASEEELKRWNGVIKRNIHLSDELAKKVEAEKERIFGDVNKVLGVGIRAGFRYGMLKNDPLFDKHPKCATCEEYIAVAEQKMDEWNCDAIFLAIDDREYWEKFVKHFGTKCRYVDRKLHHYFNNDHAVESLEELYIEYGGRRIGTRKKNEEYVVETHILASCHALYAGVGSATVFAYFLNGGKYENIEVYNEGVYKGLGKKKHNPA